MLTYVLDTHTLIWYLAQDTRLSPIAETIMDRLDIRLVISTMVLAEIKHLAHKNRVTQSLETVLQAITRDTRCFIYPVDLNVIYHAPTTLDIHDSIIVGTALVLGNKLAGVITQDMKITDSAIVPVIW